MQKKKKNQAPLFSETPCVNNPGIHLVIRIKCSLAVWCWSKLQLRIMKEITSVSWHIWFNSRAPLSLHENIIFLAEHIQFIWHGNSKHCTCVVVPWMPPKRPIVPFSMWTKDLFGSALVSGTEFLVARKPAWIKWYLWSGGGDMFCCSCVFGLW